MRMNAKIFSTLGAAILAVTGFSGCGSGGSSTGPTVVTVSPSNPSVAVGETQTFTANVVPTGAGTPTWSVKGAGTIDSNTGVYTAPSSVPATPDTVIASVGNSTGSAIVNVTTSQALQIMPSGPTVAAGGMKSFTATADGNPVGSVTWQVNGLNGGDCVAPPNNATTPCHGTIDGNGNFTAPLSPPPGGVAVITALSGTDSGSTNATVQYSSASLTKDGSTGQYAFQYAGSDFINNGFPLDVAGSIQTSGSSSSQSGTITGGEIDINSATVGVTIAAAITGGTYQVNAPDGRISMTIQTSSSTISSFTFQLVLTTNQHGLLIDFDNFGTGSGAIDAQNSNAFGGSLSGNYVFSISGIDPNFIPLFAAGAFSANGGSIPVNNPSSPTNTQDVVGQGLTTPIVMNDITLNGTYTTNVDANGRGTLALISTPLGTLNFAFYMVDRTHANIVELDFGPTAPLLFGQIFSAPINATPLTGGVTFTSGGSSGGGNFDPYVVGGLFTINNASVSSGGVLDINTSSGSQVATPITGGNYTGSTASGNVPGRFTLNLTTGKGSLEFAAYTTTIGTALIIQIDTNTDGSTGTAFQQSSPALVVGSFATNLTGVGASKTLGAFEQDASGQVVLTANGNTPIVNSGTLDLNSGASGPVMLAINPSKSTFNAPTNNRGTAVLSTANGPFSITYYLVSPTTVLYIDTDKNRVASGIFLDQF
jgi:hypothetical protein